MWVLVRPLRKREKIFLLYLGLVLILALILISLFQVNTSNPSKVYSEYLSKSAKFLLTIVDPIFSNFEAWSTGDSKGSTNSISQEDRGIKIDGVPYGITVDSTNNIIYVVDKFYKKITFIDGNTNSVIRTVTIPSSRSSNFLYNVTDFSSAIAFNPLFNLLYVTNSGSDIISVLSGSDGKVISNITIDGSPRALAIDKDYGVLVVTNNVPLRGYSPLKSMVYHISGFYNRLDYTQTAKIGEYLTAIDVDPFGLVYVTGAQGLKNNVYRINDTSTALFNEGQVSNITLDSGYNYNLAVAVNPINNETYVPRHMNGSGYGTIFHFKDFEKYHNSSHTVPHIDVVGAPVGVAVNNNTNLVYITNSELNRVHIINGSSNKIIGNITVGTDPWYLAVNSRTNMIYVNNIRSGTVSAINGTSNKLTVTIRYNVDPPNAGFITCNEQRIVKNTSFYDIGSLLKCEAHPNTGFQFSSWSGDLYANPNPSAVTLKVSKFGTLSANFVQSSPVIIPPELWAPLYALIPGFIGSTLIPYFLQERKEKKHSKKLKEYLDDIGKVDRDKLEEKITNSYTRREISDSQYRLLKERISDYYDDKVGSI